MRYLGKKSCHERVAEFRCRLSLCLKLSGRGDGFKGGDGFDQAGDS